VHGEEISDFGLRNADLKSRRQEIGVRSQPFDPFDFAQSKQAQGRHSEFRRKTVKPKFL
jgi:hypothetical protein